MLHFYSISVKTVKTLHKNVIVKKTKERGGGKFPIVGLIFPLKYRGKLKRALAHLTDGFQSV